MMKSHRGRHLRGFALGRDPPRSGKRFPRSTGCCPVWCGVTNTPRGIRDTQPASAYVANRNNETSAGSRRLISVRRPSRLGLLSGAGVFA